MKKWILLFVLITNGCVSVSDNLYDLKTINIDSSLEKIGSVENIDIFASKKENANSLSSFLYLNKIQNISDMTLLHRPSNLKHYNLRYKKVSMISGRKYTASGYTYHRYYPSEKNYGKKSLPEDRFLQENYKHWVGFCATEIYVFTEGFEFSYGKNEFCSKTRIIAPKSSIHDFSGIYFEELLNEALSKISVE
jgi:hypothetical protein